MSDTHCPFHGDSCPHDARGYSLYPTRHGLTPAAIDGWAPSGVSLDPACGRPWSEHPGPESGAPMRCPSAEDQRKAGGTKRSHSFKPGQSGMACVQMVMRDDGGDVCGLPPWHQVHGSGPDITDQDVGDVAEWLHPLWFESDYGRSQTYGQLLEAVRGALESRAGAMHDRWVAGAEDRLVPLLRSAANLCARSPLCVPTEYAE